MSRYNLLSAYCLNDGNILIQQTKNLHKPSQVNIDLAKKDEVIMLLCSTSRSRF